MAVATSDAPSGKKAKRKHVKKDGTVEAPATTIAAAPSSKPGKPGSSKRKKPADAEAAVRSQDVSGAVAEPQTAAALAAAGDALTRQKKRRRKKQGDEPPADASPEELARRAYQKERQELARRLQAAGREYKRQKPQKAKAAKVGQPIGGTKGSGSQQPTGGGTKGKGSKEAPWETGDRPDHPVAVIVVPIFWLKREREMKEVLQAAAAIKKILAAIGVDAGVDSTTPMSPGQKYRYWEMQGVKVRLEVGPKEAQEGGCILSISTKPGEVAAKTPLPVDHKLLDAVRTQLQLPSGDAAADAAALRQHSTPAAGPVPGNDRGSGGSGGQQLNIGRLSGNRSGDGGSHPTGKHTVFGGDDLDDDFSLKAAEPQSDAQAKKKTKKIAPPPDGPAVILKLGKAKAAVAAKVVKF